MSDHDYGPGPAALRMVADSLQVSGMLGDENVDPDEPLTLNEDGHWKLVWAEIGARMTDPPEEGRGITTLMTGACAYKARHGEWPTVAELMYEWAYWTRRIADEMEGGDA